jgi:hypothetical protein
MIVLMQALVPMENAFSVDINHPGHLAEHTIVVISVMSGITVTEKAIV